MVSDCWFFDFLGRYLPLAGLADLAEERLGHFAASQAPASDGAGCFKWWCHTVVGTTTLYQPFFTPLPFSCLPKQRIALFTAP